MRLDYGFTSTMQERGPSLLILFGQWVGPFSIKVTPKEGCWYSMDYFCSYQAACEKCFANFLSWKPSVNFKSQNKQRAKRRYVDMSGKNWKKEKN